MNITNSLIAGRTSKKVEETCLTKNIIRARQLDINQVKTLLRSNLMDIFAILHTTHESNSAV